MLDKVEDEPPMVYSRLWAHDGNNSLKRVLPFGNRKAADVRVFDGSEYFLPRKFVDKFANEVKPSDPSRHREIRSLGADSGDEGDDEDELIKEGEQDAALRELAQLGVAAPNKKNRA